MSAFYAILVYLIQTLLSLYLGAMLLRFILQLVRADFYNPICQFIVKITNPLVIPLRRVIPGFAGFDIASLLLAILLQIAGIAAIFLIPFRRTSCPGATSSWWRPRRHSAAGANVLFCVAGHDHFELGCTGQPPSCDLSSAPDHEPLMAPLRSMLPSMGGLDFSPILAFILINIIQIALRHMAAAAGVLGFAPWLS